MRPLAWIAFAFLVGGAAMMFLGTAWRPFGCGAMLTAGTLYGYAIWKVARQIADIRRRADAMLERAAQEMEKKRR